ncbi:myosin-binding protein 7-like [Phragmites australis]|uniref:myosin-binding protein 7-like n=1 Tax=Phragmites australis TaxID=29695 RepID=UPI002D769222|nr:myosin-binding protein 7-like [Phragmites australis]
MEENHDQDTDPPPAAGGWCRCCSAPSGAAVWRRSVKRKLDAEKGVEGEEGAAGGLARVEAEEECAALREAVAAAQDVAALLRADVEEERLAAASAASEAMAMMLRLQREKAEVQMELRQFRRFADEKMALDAGEIEHLRALLAGRARCLVRLRARLREYRLQCLHLGIPLPEGEDLVAQNGEEEEDLFLLEGEDGNEGYYPELRCHDGEYYYEDVQEEDAVVVDLERRICHLEHDQETHLLEQPLEEEDVAHLYTDEVLPESSGPGRGGHYANGMLPKVAMEERSNLYDDDEELPESPAAGCVGEEEASETDGVGSASGSGSDRVYMIDKVHQGVSAPIARVPEKYQDEAVEPDIKKLYMRLEALEADRESMRQALVAMRTEKVQLGLLREIAQQLAKDAAPSGVVPGLHHSPGKHIVGVVERRFTEDKKVALIKTFSMVALFKWFLTLFGKKKKPLQSRYTFGLSSNNVGLLLLLDKCPRIQKTLRRTT